MLAKVNPIKEAEEIVKLETTLENNFMLSNSEIQQTPKAIINYLIGLLVKRSQREKFEKMRLKNRNSNY